MLLALLAWAAPLGVLVAGAAGWRVIKCYTCNIYLWSCSILYNSCRNWSDRVTCTAGLGCSTGGTGSRGGWLEGYCLWKTLLGKSKGLHGHTD